MLHSGLSLLRFLLGRRGLLHQRRTGPLLLLPLMAPLLQSIRSGRLPRLLLGQRAPLLLMHPPPQRDLLLLHPQVRLGLSLLLLHLDQSVPLLGH